jgi:competence protein ComEA
VARVRALLAAPDSAPEADVPASVPELLSTARVDPSRRGVVALGVVALVAALVAGVVLLRGRPAEVPLSVPSVVGQAEQSGGPQIVVDVAGKVRRPGLVRLPEGARVDDALRAAGGVVPGADTLTLNRARKLMDGEQLVVGLEPAPGAGGGSATAGGRLNLNLATVEDFDGLPGIGPVLAQRIVDWRTEHGRFASVDQLREVSGIGEAKYASLKSKVAV